MESRVWRRTVRPRRLLQGPLIQKEPPRRLECDITLERRHALELRVQLVCIPGLEWGPFRSDVGVQVEDRCEDVSRGAGEEFLLNEGAELVFGASDSVRSARERLSGNERDAERHVRYVEAACGEDCAFVERVSCETESILT